MKSIFPIAILLGFFALAANQPPAVFTKEQAVLGKAAYESTCGKCHTSNLTGRTGAPGELPEVSSLPDGMQKVLQAYRGKVPPLVGEKFLAKWANTAVFSNRIKEAVGGFPPEGTNAQTHFLLAAYILEVNGARPGTEPLTASTVVELQSLNLSAHH